MAVRSFTEGAVGAAYGNEGAACTFVGATYRNVGAAPWALPTVRAAPSWQSARQSWLETSARPPAFLGTAAVAQYHRAVVLTRLDQDHANQDIAMLQGNLGRVTVFCQV